MPAPKVDSTVIRTRLYKEKPYNPKDTALLFRTIKAAFEQRRKTLPNALASGFGELDKQTLTDIIVSCGHSADVRGERLSIEDFVALSDAIYDQIHA
jgi:16S rRNA (adenine1518-N6/adenine1519-N6)-dimethyltransferase